MLQLGTDGLVLPYASAVEFSPTVSTRDATERITVHTTAVLSIRVWKGASGLKTAITVVPTVARGAKPSGSSVAINE